MTNYLTRKALPYWCVLLADTVAAYCSTLLIYTLNQGLPGVDAFIAIAIAMVPYLIGFRCFRTYSGILRYSSFVDLQRVAYAVLTALVIALALRYGLEAYHIKSPLHSFAIVLGAVIAMLLMWALRIGVKNLYDIISNSNTAPLVFIYGTRDGGIGLAKSIRNDNNPPYRIAGFISQEHDRHVHYLMGRRVYHTDDDIVSIMLHAGARILLVSPRYNAVITSGSAFVDALIKAGIRIRIYQQDVEWDGKSELQATQLRDIEVEDLLPRAPIKINLDEARQQLTDKTILITGAAGSIGSEIVEQVARFAPARLVLVDQAETPLHDIRLMMATKYRYIRCQTIVADMCDARRMEDIFRDSRPQYVFHAAAYKHVPMMEDNPREALRNNIGGTVILADLAVKYGARKFVMISTDKAVNPTNVMGCSKRICEIYVQALNTAVAAAGKNATQFVTTRFGNVLGSNGSVIPLFKEQIRRGGPVTVTHPDIIRFFMLIPEACRLVLEAGTMGKGGEIFVFDMGKPVKIADLAKRMIQLSGAQNVRIEYTGLRDGEKLYEEVLDNDETTRPTPHPMIRVAAVRQYDYAEVRRAIAAMVDAAVAGQEDDMALVKRMKDLVPEFRSQNSKYEALDDKPQPADTDQLPLATPEHHVVFRLAEGGDLH